jgi:DNA-binding NtrC family response regulator
MGGAGRMATILLVDDEPKLLKLLENYLHRLGYGVAACPSASRAWELFSESPHDFDLAVLDVRMPVINGQELSARMLAVNPAVRLIFSSGYPFDISRIPAADPRRIEFLQKPYSPLMLADALRRLLRPPAGEDAGAARNSAAEPGPR